MGKSATDASTAVKFSLSFPFNFLSPPTYPQHPANPTSTLAEQFRDGLQKVQLSSDKQLNVIQERGLDYDDCESVMRLHVQR